MVRGERRGRVGEGRLGALFWSCWLKGMEFLPKVEGCREGERGDGGVIENRETGLWFAPVA